MALNNAYFNVVFACDIHNRRSEFLLRGKELHILGFGINRYYIINAYCAESVAAFKYD